MASVFIAPCSMAEIEAALLGQLGDSAAAARSYETITNQLMTLLDAPKKPLLDIGNDSPSAYYTDQASGRSAVSPAQWPGRSDSPPHVTTKVQATLALTLNLTP